MTSRNQSILIGGLIVGLLSTSYLSFINCLCCAGVLIGSAGAVWHYTTQNGLTISPTEGVKMGVLAALVGFAIAFVLNLLLMSLGIRHDLAITDFMLNSFGDSMPPEQIEQMEAQREAPLMESLFSFNQLIGLAVTAAFGAAGGAIGAALFKKGDPEADIGPATV